MKSPQLQKTKGYFVMTASEIKIMPQSVRKYPSNIPSHIETSQSTCFENQLTGFHTAQVSTKDISKQTLMGHSKVQKIKKENYQLNQSRIQNLTNAPVKNSAYSMYLRVAFDSFLVRFHSFLVKVYLPVCKIFLHFKSIFENIYLQL